MTLNKFLDTTLEAAKQSALQIYDDDYSHLKDVLHNNEENNSGESSADGEEEQKKEKSPENKAKQPKQGVVFERSSEKKADKKKPQKKSSKLDSIRKYAARQTQSDEDINGWDAKKEPTNSDEQHPKKESPPTKQVYSRKDLRKSSTPVKGQNNKAKDEIENRTENETTNLVDQSVNTFPNGFAKESDTESKDEDFNRSIHKRIDRLESLMHLALSSPDHQFSAHPIYHKLLHKGVPQKDINSWFDKLTQKRINPDKQKKLFSSKLSQLIQELLEGSKAGPASKNLLVTGRSGSGKTQLIMKLYKHSSFFADKKIAIASVLPQGDIQNYYSILDPFCKDNGLDFYPIDNDYSVEQYREEWSRFDHVLIDTPPLENGGKSLVNGILKIQEELQDQDGIETHYLINTAVNGNAFNDPLAVEIEADHIALTHIDQSIKWGKTVQLITKRDYNLRYISSGPSIPGSLIPFDPEKFAQKLIR